MNHDQTFGSRPREPVRFLVFSASLRRGSLNSQPADEQLQQRFDTNLINFMDQVEASTHYPCVKRAWVEYLGEHQEPVLDRVE